VPPDDQTASDTEQPVDLNAQLNAAFDEAMAKNDAPEDGEKASGDRPRRPDGRFAKAEEAATDGGTESETKTEPETPVTNTESAAKAEATPTAHEPPANWSEADKTAFKTLPAEAQSILLKRHGDMESDYTRKTQAIAAFRRDYEPVQQMMAPFEQQIRNAGFTPATLIQAWAKVERDLTEGRGLNVVRDLVTNYRIDKAALARELGLVAPAAGVDPPPQPNGANGTSHLPPEVVKALEQVQALDRRQSQFDQFLTTQQQQRYNEEARRVETAVTAFRDAKDASGNLLHPHYADLEDDMIAFLTAARSQGQEPTLDELYDKAVYSNPSTRAKVLESQRAAETAQRTAAETKARDEARAKAEKARRAGSSVTGQPGASQAAIAAAKANGGSLRDVLERAADDAFSAL
jgi:hypothetical protein